MNYIGQSFSLYFEFYLNSWSWGGIVASSRLGKQRAAGPSLTQDTYVLINC